MLGLDYLQPPVTFAWMQQRSDQLLKKKKVTSNTHYIHSFSWRFYFYFIYLLLTCPSCISFTIGPFKKKKKKSSKNQNNYMCDLFTCDIFLINAWRSNQNPSIYNQHKQCQLSDMLLTVWTHKQLDTVIYSTKVLAKWKSGEKNKRQLSVTFSISQDLDDVFFMFMVHSAAGSRCTDNLVEGVMTHRVFVRLHQTVSFLLVNMFGRLGGEKKKI